MCVCDDFVCMCTIIMPIYKRAGIELASCEFARGINYRSDVMEIADFAGDVFAMCFFFLC